MSIKNRIKKIEQMNKGNCLCNKKAFLSLWRGAPDAVALTSCVKCQPSFEFWKNLADEAKAIRNQPAFD